MQTEKRILIAEDDSELRDTIREVMELNGVQTEVASNGEEALRMIDESDFDLLVTDIVMPQKDGIELMLDIKKRNKEIKIIAVSGGGLLCPDLYLKTAKVIGATILKKPFELKEIVDEVEKALK